MPKVTILDPHNNGNTNIGGDICGHNLYIQDISAQNITANVFREPFISSHTTFVVTVAPKTPNNHTR